MSKQLFESKWSKFLTEENGDFETLKKKVVNDVISNLGLQDNPQENIYDKKFLEFLTNQEPFVVELVNSKSQEELEKLLREDGDDWDWIFGDENEEINESYQDNLEDLLADVGSEMEISAYIESLNRDKNQDGYKNFTDDDYIEDFKNYLADKSLEEVGSGMEDTVQYKGVEHEITRREGDRVYIRVKAPSAHLGKLDSFWVKQDDLGGNVEGVDEEKVIKLVAWFKQFFSYTLKKGAGAQDNELDAYFESISRDLLRTGLNDESDYKDWSFDDYIEDFKNFVADKGLGEAGGSEEEGYFGSDLSPEEQGEEAEYEDFQSQLSDKFTEVDGVDEKMDLPWPFNSKDDEDEDDDSTYDDPSEPVIWKI